MSLDETLTEYDSLQEEHCNDLCHQNGQNEYDQLRNMLKIFRIMSWGKIPNHSLLKPSEAKPPKQQQLMPSKRFEYAKKLVGSKWSAGSDDDLKASLDTDNIEEFFNDAGMIHEVDKNVFRHWIGGAVEFVEDVKKVVKPINAVRQATRGT